MSGNIPIGGNNRIVKPQNNSNVAGARTTHTRALGSNASSIFPGGWRPAARGENPNDTQTMRNGLYGRMRAGANAHAMGRSFGGMTMNATQQTNGMSDMEKAAFAIAMGKMGVELGKGIADIVNAFSTEKSDGAAPKVKDGTTPESKSTSSSGSSATTISSENASFVSDMTSATDAASLNSAIGNAKAKLAEINGSLTQLKSDAERAQRQVGTLQSQYDAKLLEYQQAERDLQGAEQDVKRTGSSLKAAKDNLKAAIKGADNACIAYAESQANTQIAQSNFASIEAKYNAAEGEAKAALAPAYAEAQTKLAEAVAAEEKAKIARDEALKNKGNVESTVVAEERKVAEAHKNHELAKARVEELEAQKDKLNKEMDDLGKQIKEQNGIVQKYETAKKDAVELDAQIKQQEIRLGTLQEAEAEAYADLKGQIDGGVDTKAERQAIEDMTEMRGNAIQGILKGPSENIAGVEFRTGKGPDGSTIYLVGDKSVTESEYNSKRTELEKLQPSITALSNYESGDMPEGFADNGIYQEVLAGKDLRTGKLTDGTKIYLIDGEPVSEATYNREAAVASKCHDIDSALKLGGEPTIINGDKFEVTSDYKCKINGKIVSPTELKAAMVKARGAEADSKKAANMKNTLIQAQVNSEGTTVGNTKVNINVDTKTGQITYTIGDETNLTKAQFDEKFKKLFA